MIVPVRPIKQSSTQMASQQEEGEVSEPKERKCKMQGGGEPTMLLTGRHNKQEGGGGGEEEG
jgi:hypothetical protein